MATAIELRLWSQLDGSSHRVSCHRAAIASSLRQRRRQETVRKRRPRFWTVSWGWAWAEQGHALRPTPNPFARTLQRQVISLPLQRSSLELPPTGCTHHPRSFGKYFPEASRLLGGPVGGVKQRETRETQGFARFAECPQLAHPVVEQVMDVIISRRK